MKPTLEQKIKNTILAVAITVSTSALIGCCLNDGFVSLPEVARQYRARQYKLEHEDEARRVMSIISQEYKGTTEEKNKLLEDVYNEITDYPYKSLAEENEHMEKIVETLRREER